jgi:predicted nucleotidyltransferase
MKTSAQFSPETIANYRRAFQRRAQAHFQANEHRRQQARQAIAEAIKTVIPHYPTIRRVYLFGSVTRPGAFGPDSDVDIGLEGANMALCLDIWRDLERAVPAWRLDVRSLDPEDLFTERVRQKGEMVYEQSTSDS